jgi:hypothetical protein
VPPRNPRNQATGIHIEWFTVTKRSVYILVGILLILASGGAGGYFYYLSLTEPKVSSNTVMNQPVEQRRAANFLEIHGAVKVKKAGTWDWVNAQMGIPLEKDDQIRTVGRSTARVRFFDGTEYVLNPESFLIIEESREDPQTAERQVAVKLTAGQVNLSTARKNVAGSRSELATPTSEATFGEMTRAAVGFDEGRQVAGYTVYEGETNLRAGTSQLTLRTNEKVEVTSNRVFTEVTHLPAIPVILSPANLSQVVLANPGRDPIPLSWEPVSGAAKYHVQLDRTSNFSEPLFEGDFRGVTTAFVPSQALGSYFWRVRAIDAKNLEGGFSAFARFTITSPAAAAAPPTLVVREEHSLDGLVTVLGQTDADALVTVNNDKVQVKPDGSFATYVDLSGRPGRHEIVVRAMNRRSGGAAEKTLYVNLGQP